MGLFESLQTDWIELEMLEFWPKSRTWRDFSQICRWVLEVHGFCRWVLNISSNRWKSSSKCSNSDLKEDTYEVLSNAVNSKIWDWILKVGVVLPDGFSLISLNRQELSSECLNSCQNSRTWSISPKSETWWFTGFGGGFLKFNQKEFKLKMPDSNPRKRKMRRFFHWPHL